MKPSSKKRASTGKKEKDYRLNKSASKRTLEARDAIRDTLALGKETFGDLEAATKLSRPALASNLKKMYREGEVDRKTDPEDYRVTRYSLKDDGWRKYREQRVKQILKEAESTSLGVIMDIVVEYMASALKAVTGVTNLLQRDIGKDTTLPQLTKYEEDILQGCLRGKIYARTTEKGHALYFEPLREFLAMVKLVTASKDVDPELLEGLSDIFFVFKFSRKRLIEQYKILKGKRESLQKTE